MAKTSHITISSNGLRNVGTFAAKTRSKVANITSPFSWALGERMESTVTNRINVFVASFMVVIAVSIIGGLASAELPFPILGLTIPIALLFINPWVGVPVVGVLFFLLWLWWFKPLIKRETKLNKSSVYVIGVLFVFSLIWYFMSWEVANTWRRPSHASGCAIINAMLMVAVIVIGIKAIKNQSQSLSILFRGFVIFWACTYGYSYFGELP